MAASGSTFKGGLLDALFNSNECLFLLTSVTESNVLDLAGFSNLFLWRSTVIVIVETFGVFLVWFSNTFPRGDVNLGYSFAFNEKVIFLCRQDIHIERYSYRSILPDDNLIFLQLLYRYRIVFFLQLSSLHFIFLLIKVILQFIWDGCLIAIFEALICLGIFIIKWCVEFSLILFSTRK